MILGIDIGNSNIVAGLIEKDKVISVFRTETDYSMSVKSCLDYLDSAIKYANPENAVISSVVKPLTPIMEEALCALGFNPFIVNHSLKTGLNFSIENPEKLGCDRIADCAAAAALYPLPAVVIDFGTATTISVIGRGAVFLGGAIAPGLKMSAKALSGGTSQLPLVEIESPAGCIGKNTFDCIKSGIILGTASMADGMIARIENILGTSVCAVATGGLAKIVVPHCARSLILDRDLLLRGLGIIYDLNR